MKDYFMLTFYSYNNENKLEATTAGQGPLKFRFGSNFWQMVSGMFCISSVLQEIMSIWNALKKLAANQSSVSECS